MFKFMQIAVLHNWFTKRKLAGLLRQKASKQVLQSFRPESGNFLYIPASCLPFHVSGYTTRTQSVLKAVSSEVRGLYVLTRTGYPWDRKDSLSLPEGDAFQCSNILDDIRYDHIRTPTNSKLTVVYAEQASKEIEKYIVEHNISCVHAASNHVNALPALIAAKRLGIPFQYEMRGLWELTRISRDPSFADSHNFKLGLELEAFAARNADRVFVISEQLSLYIQKNWGIDPNKISLLPNCADTDSVKPAGKVAASSESSSEDKHHNSSIDSPITVIGYAGSLIVYEGIQTLLRSIDILVHRLHITGLRLNIVGDGEYRKNLERLSADLNLQEFVTFLGRLSPEDAKAKQDEFDLICLPREPFEVCKIVPPIKLVEAMAKEKCVLVPDLPVFCDELGLDGDKDSSGCLFFKSGDAEDLSRVIADVIAENNTVRRNLAERGRRAREYVKKHRQWKQFAPNICPSYKKKTNAK